MRYTECYDCGATCENTGRMSRCKDCKPFKAIDHYTGKEKEYQFLTLDEIKALTGYALIVGNKGDILRVKINGKVKTWKRDVNRFEVPCKYGLYEYATINTLNKFVKEV